MSEKVTITLTSGDFKRFDLIKFHSIGQNQVVVKKRYKHHCYTYTVKTVKWSKYQLFRFFQRLYLIIKYR